MGAGFGPWGRASSSARDMGFSSDETSTTRSRVPSAAKGTLPNDRRIRWRHGTSYGVKIAHRGLRQLYEYGNARRLHPPLIPRIFDNGQAVDVDLTDSH